MDTRGSGLNHNGMKQYFSDFFEVSPDIIEEYGAFNISLIADLPLFIDPFLLFNSDKEEYRKLHDQMIQYLSFLKNKSTNQELDKGLISAWYKFPEVKQNWLGFSAKDNSGSGLGSKFASALHRNLHRIFKDFGQERVTQSSHLEKLCLIGSGIGRDNISDFTTNLIKDFLANYTQEFARRHLAKKFRTTVAVPKVRFNYETESWQPGEYELPIYNGDYILLTPVDILTRDDTWINRPDLVDGFERIVSAIPDDSLRAQLNNYFSKRLYELVGDGEEKKKHRTKAADDTISEIPEIIDYFIRFKEENGDEAESLSSSKVAESKRLYIKQFAQLGEQLARSSDFYKLKGDSYSEAFERIQILKDVIENQEGYKIFYFDDKPIEREEDLRILFRLTWRAKSLSSQGAKLIKPAKNNFSIIVKLARNSQLPKGLRKYAEEHEKSPTAPHPILIIFYFNDDEYLTVKGLLNHLGVANLSNIVLIGAYNERLSLDINSSESDSESEHIKMSATFDKGYALLIGVGADLSMTVQDATALRNILIDPQRAAYPKNQVQLLTESGATRQAILDAFDRIIEQSNNNPDATVIVYYSGHGGRIGKGNQTSEYFLVPFGYDPNNRNQTAISGQEFTTKIQAIKARTLIVLLDCCHAGGMPIIKDVEETFIKSPVPPDLINVLSSGSGRIIIASSREDEYSIAEAKYSVFTDCLLNALSGQASQSKDGYARILDVLSYLYQQVPKRTADRQHPFVNNITNLTDNLPICYYAGGRKEISGEPTLQQPEQPTIPNELTTGERARLEKKLERFQSDWNVLNEKIDRIRKSLAIEAQVLPKFQLEQQLLAEEANIAKLESDMEQIERRLKNG